MTPVFRLNALRSIHRPLAALLLIAVMASVAAPAAAASVNPEPTNSQAAQYPAPPEIPQPGEIIVRYKEIPTEGEMSLLLASQRASATPSSADPHLQVIRPWEEGSLDEQLSQLRADPRVEYAEPNYLFRAAGLNDPGLGSQWAHGELDTAGAWAEIPVASAAPITVAVVDSGVDTAHEDLTGRLLSGRNFIAGAPDPTNVADELGHGTHAAGLIAAKANNATGGAGIAGELPVSILPVKALDSKGFGTMLDIAQGIRWAADSGARVINLSFGARLPDYPRTLAEAINYAQDRGALVVAAAGNEGAALAGYYPASLPGVVAVAATGADHRRALFANEAPIRAPGLAVRSTLPGSSYGDLSGTSVAAAVASGVAAVLSSAYPTLSAEEVSAALLLGQKEWGSGGEFLRVLNMRQALHELAGPPDLFPTLTVLQPVSEWISGTTTFLVHVENAIALDTVSFYLVDGASESLLGTVPGDSSGQVGFAWDSTSVANGPHTIRIVARNAQGDDLAEGTRSVIVENGVSGGLTISVIKPDGSPAAGVDLSLYTRYEGQEGLVLLEQFKADLNGRLRLPSSRATDGHSFLIVAQGSDPAFLYTKEVTAPAQVTLDASLASPVTFEGLVQGKTGSEPAANATLWANLSHTGVSVGEKELSPLLLLDGSGSGTAYLSPGSYTFRLISSDLSQYQVVRSLSIQGPDSVRVEPPAAGLATLKLYQGQAILRYEVTWTDEADGFRLPGDQSPRLVTGGVYSAEIAATASTESERYNYWFSVPKVEAAAGGEAVVTFGDTAQLALEANRTGEVSKPSTVVLTPRLTDGFGNPIRYSYGSITYTVTPPDGPAYATSNSWEVDTETPGLYSIQARYYAPGLTPGYIYSNTLTFTVTAQRTEPLQVTVKQRSGQPALNAAVSLYQATEAGYRRVGFARTDTNGVAGFPSYDPSLPLWVAVEGETPNPNDPTSDWEPYYVVQPVPEGTEPTSLTIDLSSLAMHRVTLTAQDAANAPLYNGAVRYFVYLRDAAGRLLGTELDRRTLPEGYPVWVSEGQYLFQALDRLGRDVPGSRYVLLSDPVTVAEDRSVTLGGSGLTRLTVSPAQGLEGSAVLGLFAVDYPESYAHRVPDGSPVYVSPGRYRVETRLSVEHYTGTWQYWLAREVTAQSEVELSWQVGTDFTMRLTGLQPLYRSAAPLVTHHEIADSHGNRLVHMEAAVATTFALPPTGSPDLIAPFLVIEDQTGKEVFRQKVVDPILEHGQTRAQFAAAWNCSLGSTCPSLDPSEGPSSYFGQSLTIPDHWKGSFTAHLLLGADPDSTLRSAAVPFTVSNTPVIDSLPPATRAESIPITGLGRPGSTIALSYRVDGGEPTPLGTTLTNAEGRFSLPAVLPAEGTYSFTAVANWDGEESDPSDPVTLRVDRTAPVWPAEALTVKSVSDTQIGLAWTAPTDPDLASFELWRDGTLLRTVDAATADYLDTGLQPETTYVYTVTAVDQAGNRSSAELQAATGHLPDTQPPTAPSGLQAQVAGSEVRLTWEANPASEGVTSYRLYRSADGGPAVTLATIDGDLSFTDTGLNAETTYTYTLTALDAAGNESEAGEPSIIRTGALVIQQVAVRATPRTRYGAAQPGATIQITLVGEPGRTAEAQVEYEHWVDGHPTTGQQTLVLTASEAAPGAYLGSFSLPQATAAVTRVTGLLADSAGHVVRQEAGGLPLPVAGSLALQVATPAGATDADVAAAIKGGKLTAWSESARSGGQLNTTDSATAYRLDGLTPATDYVVRLVDGDGRELARQTSVTVSGGKESAVAISPALPATLQVRLLGIDGKPLSSAMKGQFKVEGSTYAVLWSSDWTGLTGALTGRLSGETVRVIPMASLPFRADQSQTFQLQPGHNLVTMQLQEHPKGTVEGTVTDHAGAPAQYKGITLRQEIAGQLVVTRGRTDAAGHFQIQGYAGAGELTVEALDLRAEPLPVTLLENQTVTQGIVAQGRRETRVEILLYTRSATGNWEGPMQLDHRTAYHFRISVQAPNGSQVGYPFVVRALPGEKVTACISGAESGLPNACHTAAVTEAQTARVEFRLDGRLTSKLTLRVTDAATGAPASYESGVLYRQGEAGRNVVQLLPGGTTELVVSEGGAYSLFLRGADGKLGESSFNVTLGGAQVVSMSLFDSAHFTGRPGNSVTAGAAQVGAEKLLTYQVEYRNHGPAVTDATLQIYLSAGATLVAESVRLNGQPAPVEEGGVVVGSLAQGASGTLSFTTRVPSGAADPALTATVRMSHSLTQWPEILGTGVALWKPVSIQAPPKVNTQQITVTGTAPIGSNVVLYSGGTALGSATVSAGGQWSIRAQLPGPASLTVGHELIAAVEDSQGQELHRASTYVTYGPDTPVLKQMTLTRINENGQVTAVRVDPSQSVPRFPVVVVPGQPITLELEFDDPNRVRDLFVSVRGMRPITMQRGADGIFRGQLIWVAGTPGPIQVTYLGQPKPFSQASQPSLTDMREGLPPALYNATVARQNISGNTTNDPSAGTGTANLLFHLDGDPTRPLTVSLSVTPLERFTPTADDAARVAAGGAPIYNLEIEEVSGGIRLSGVIDTGAAGNQLAAKNLLEGTKAFVMFMHTGGRFVDFVNQGMSMDGYLGLFARLQEMRRLAQACDYVGREHYNSLLDIQEKQVYRWMALSAGMAATSGVLTLSGVGALGGAGLFIIGFAADYVIGEQINKGLDAIAKRMGNDPWCKGKEVADPKWIMDPGGYVYEAVPENRLEGVTTTLMEKQPDGSWLVWDSAWFGQQNPLTTNAEGLYAWDVPEGDWQVLYQKQGYADSLSPVLHVPPPQTDVNQGLVSLAAPAVEQIKAGPNGAYLDITFSQYMKATTLSETTISLTSPDSTPVTGSVSPLNPVNADSGVPVTRTARFTPAAPLNLGATYRVDVSDMVQNYADRPMAEGLVTTFTVPADVTPPGQVTGVSVEPADGRLTLRWVNPADADFNRVRIATSATGFDQWRETNGSSLTLNDLNNGQTYAIRLVTADLAGNLSEPVTVTASPVDLTPPGPVTNVTVQADRGKLSLRWADPAALDLTTIRLVWKGPANQSGTVLLGPGDRLYELGSLGEGQSYSFTLTALDLAGNESAPVTVTGTTPGETSGGGGNPPPDSNDPPLGETPPSEPEQPGLPVPVGGGTFRLAGGQVTLTLPEGGLPEGTRLQVVAADQPEPSDPSLIVASPAYQITAGDAALTGLATLSLGYAPQSGDPRGLGLYRQDPIDPKRWHYVGGVLLTASGAVRGQIRELGTYAVMRRANSFGDLADHWSQEEVEVLLSRGIAWGATSTAFRPDRPATRAEVAKLLVLILLQDPERELRLDPPASSPFADVAPSHPDYAYVAAAAQLGIILGYNGQFRPEDPVNRAEFATMLYRALGTPGEPAASGSTLPFIDSAEIPQWALPSIAWAAAEGLLQGDPLGRVLPQGKTTRAELMVVALRAMTRLGLISVEE